MFLQLDSDTAHRLRPLARDADAAMHPQLYVFARLLLRNGGVVSIDII